MGIVKKRYKPKLENVYKLKGYLKRINNKIAKKVLY
jgi:hypothetical protein|tara:strand:- start:178 stop:285 length:108 start_codon:yes stop_codon:yes gene_type:complete